MTGVEAVSNGVPAFRPPESRNAASTLVVMGALAITMFLGITLLAHAYALVPNNAETVISQLARVTFGSGTAFYFAVQAATMLILVLAANTAYADFPRLASIVARDRFLPRQFTNQGDRLAFSNGILILSALAAVLLVAFAGDTHALIPLYMIGVFVSFTLSQAGMVIHWRKSGAPGWRSSAFVNGFGALVTAIVLVIVAITKAAEGAWLIILMIPALVTLFTITRRHYDQVASELTLKDWEPEPVGGHVVLVPIGGIQRAVVKALRYARSLAGDVRAVYVELDPASAHALRGQWDRVGPGRCTRRSRVAVPIADGAAARVHRADPARGSVRLRHRDPAGVRPAQAVAAPAAQSARAAHQGRAAVQTQCGGDERAVPPGPPGARSCRRQRPSHGERRRTGGIDVWEAYVQQSSGSRPRKSPRRRRVALARSSWPRLAAAAPVLTQLLEARQLAADLRLQFNKAADASNRAVMADTDEASSAAAREAEEVTGAIQRDAQALQPILQELAYADEIRLLHEFDGRFDEYRTLDRTILGLAVENTNLKAQRLSFGPAREAADAFRDSSRPSRRRRRGRLARSSAGRRRRGERARDPGATGAAHRRGR